MILGFCNIKDSMLNYGFWSIFNLNCLYKVYFVLLKILVVYYWE